MVVGRGKRGIGRAVAALLVTWATTALAAPPTGTWETGYHLDGVSGRVIGLETSPFDLWVVGSFSTAGDVVASNVARFSGGTWSSVGGGVDGTVNAVVTDAQGVWVAGTFDNAGGSAANRIAHWDGAVWTTAGIGLNGRVQALAEHAGIVYAGGDFFKAGGLDAPRIAAWDGVGWIPMGVPDDTVRAIAASDTDVFIAGDFSSADGAFVNHIARWDGGAWAPLGTGLNRQAYAMRMIGTDLYVAGNFEDAGGVPAARVARWDGSGWHAVGVGVDRAAYSLGFLGSGLAVGGSFRRLEDGTTVNYVAQVTGTTWSGFGEGTNDDVLAVAGRDSTLFAGGRFDTAGTAAVAAIAAWNGATWGPLTTGGLGLSNVANFDAVHSLVRASDGVWVGGDYSRAGSLSGPGTSPLRLARFDGANWNAIGDAPSSTVRALAIGADGTPWVGGSFVRMGELDVDRIVRRIGGAWVPTGPADGSVQALAPDLTGGMYAGGRFATIGGVAATRIAHYNGVAWEPLGAGVDGAVEAIAVNGNNVLVAGEFENAGGIPVGHVARWNGGTWEPLGLGMNGDVLALTMHEGQLYAGGEFTAADGDSGIRYIARWDGAKWVAVGTGTGGAVTALLSHGGHLYAGGRFRAEAGAPADRLAAWDGTAWAPVGVTGFDDQVLALAPDGDGVVVGGEFTHVGDTVSVLYARFVLDDPSGTTTTSSTVTTSTSTSTSTSSTSSTSSSTTVTTTTSIPSSTATSTSTPSSSVTTSSTTTTLPGSFTDEPLAGTKLILKAKRGRATRRGFKLLARVPGLTLGAGNASGDDPTMHGGILSVAASTGSAEWPLPAGQWKYIRKAGAEKGYKFKRGTPVRKVVVKRNKLVKVVAKGAELPWDLEADPSPVSVWLTLGGHRYCWHFGGTQATKAGRRFKATGASAPVDCESGSVTGAFITP